MEERPPNVLSFPSLRWAGAPRPGRDERPVRRTERRISILSIELRGGGAAGALSTVERDLAFAYALDQVLDALLGFEAFDLSLDGSTTQPVLTASLEGGDHAFRSVLAAVAVRDAVIGSHRRPAAEHLPHACIGVNTGALTDTTIGDDPPVSFASVGLLRSFAARLREWANPGEILLSGTTLEEVRDRVTVRPAGPIGVNRHGETEDAYRLLTLEAPGREG